MATLSSAGPAFWTELRNDFSESIAAISKNELQPIDQARQALRLSHEMLSQLKDSLKQFPFSNLSEQIAYYKEIEPFFVSRGIFFTRMFRLETTRPPGDRSTVEAHFQREWQYIRDFQTEHSFLWQYTRAGETWLDDKLFVANQDLQTSPFDSPLNQSLLHHASRTLGHLYAMELMQDYLLRAEEELARPRDLIERNISKLTWTDSKSALIELAYAIQSAGSLNDRKASLREIIEGLQAAFHIDLGHYPRVFQEILSRKTGYTTYIDRLRDKLLLRIKLIEEKYDPK